MLICAMLLISGAFLFYSVGVWGEKLQKTLKSWHLLFFYLGLFCDATGTYLMSQIATTVGPTGSNHALIGGVALSLMLVHAIWATVVYIRKTPHLIHSFHRFSLIVWLIWLIPYFVGMISNIVK